MARQASQEAGGQFLKIQEKGESDRPNQMIEVNYEW